MPDIKTETHEYTETKSDDWNNASNDLWIFLFLILMFGYGFQNSDTALEKEVAELKGKVDVIERLVAK